jgi:diphthamide synthase (EF-2-diphthine--ammonia ligase)
MHAVLDDVLAAQADAARLPLCRVPIPERCPDEVYADAMRCAVSQAKSGGVTHMIFGDLFLEDVRAYRESQLAGTGITPTFPLWKRSTMELAREMMSAGLVAHVTCLDPCRVPRELAGRRFDEDLLKRLGPDVDPCAENGEFHTCVSAGPMFAHAIPLQIGETVEREGFVFADLMLSRP